MQRGKFRFYFIASLILSYVGHASANPIIAGDGLFTASRSWFQFEDDVRKSLFRSYAALLINNNFVDFPNLFIMQCQANAEPYLTLHFPENYAFRGFDATTWLPKTDVAVRINGSTFRFDAELNRNEFYIDLTDVEWDHFNDIWSANGPIEFKLGPSESNLALAFGELDDPVVDLLERGGRSVTAKYSYLQMRTRCQATALAGSNSSGWTVFGSVACPSCDASAGRPYMFVNGASKKSGEPINTFAECDLLRAEMTATFTHQQVNGAALVPDLLCIGDGGWR